MTNWLCRVFFVLLWSVLVGQVGGQENNEVEAGAQPVETRQDSVLQSLAGLIAKAEGDLKELEKLRGETVSASEQLQLTEEIEAKSAEVQRLKLEFLSFAVKIEADELGPVVDEKLSLQAEVRELLEPVLSEMKDATSAPRKLESLKRKKDQLLDEQATAEKVLQRLAGQLADSPPPLVEARLKDIQESWTEKLQNLKARVDVTQYKIEELQNQDVSLLERGKQGVQAFFRTKGKNLILATLGAVLSFFMVRKGYAYCRRKNPFGKKKGTTLYTRAMDLAVRVFSLVIAAAIFVLVLYFANDWVMLVVALLFIGAILWAGKQALPQYMEQVKLILNFGPVREGERVVFQGIPWKVGRIEFYTKFTNSELKGGLIRLPIRMLTEMHSRPHEGELWFPCQKDDWVMLDDDVYGKIVEQTPEHVQLIRLGGLRKFYPTDSFLDLNPANLSKGFRVSSVFGIDYAHQEVCTTEVPRIFEAALEKAMREFLGEDILKNVSVQFCSAGASSLDYEVLADFTGDAAPRYRTLQRMIQRVCVDVCNEQGWGIPFTQITVHQAGADGGS